MAKQAEKDDQNYRSLRNEFDNLQLEEKAVFLIESGLSLFIHSVESLTHFVRDEINKMADGEKGNPEAEKEEKPQKETVPKRKPRSTTAKKTTTRSTASKRKSSTKAEKEPPNDDEDASS